MANKKKTIKLSVEIEFSNEFGGEDYEISEVMHNVVDAIRHYNFTYTIAPKSSQLTMTEATARFGNWYVTKTAL